MSQEKYTEEQKAQAEEKISLIRSIVTGGSYKTIDGQAVDLTTAHAICTVYDNLSNPDARVNFMLRDIGNIATLAWKVLEAASR